ncbi:MAG: IMP dehydrogenase [Candidatus Hodarchaeota archaeon]
MGYFRKKITSSIDVVTFHDLVLLPGWSEVEPDFVDVSSKITTNIPLTVPFVSSPMESVTESKLAVALAQIGGVGMLHRNCSIEAQLKMAQKVKATTVGNDKHLNVTLDEKNRYRVGAAVGPKDVKRVSALQDSVDVFVIDVAHFHTRSCFDGTRQILKATNVDVIVGNLGTYEATQDVLTQLEGVAGLRCGIGSGSTCTTSVQTRVSAPNVSAVAAAADACRSLGVKIPIISDGGVRNPGDAAIGLAAGAWVVMLGNVLAGTQESPTPIETINGQSYKRHWGMGSQRARQQRYALDRYSHPTKAVDEGIEGLVPMRGSVKEVIVEFIGALQASCGYIGARSIMEMWEKARFGRVSGAGMQELYPHDLE